MWLFLVLDDKGGEMGRFDNYTESCNYLSELNRNYNYTRKFKKGRKWVRYTREYTQFDRDLHKYETEVYFADLKARCESHPR